MAWMRGRGMLAAMALGFAAPVCAANLQITQLSDATSPWLMGDGTASSATQSDPAPVGAIVVYDVTLGNSDSTAASNVAAIFDLPAGATAYALPAGCVSDSATRVRCTYASIPGNGTVSFQLKMSTAGMSTGTVTTRGAIGSASAVPGAGTPISGLTNADPFFAGDSNPGNNRLSQDTTLSVAADLALAKTASPAYPTAVIGGGEVTYTLTVTNDGPAASTNFNVQDSLPPGFSVVAGSLVGAGWSVSGTTFTHSGSLGSGATSSFTFRAKAYASTGVFTNNASVHAVGTPDPRPNNDNASVDTQVVAGADLTTSIAANPTPASTDGSVVFTVKAQNLGPDAATGAKVVIALPTGFTYASFSAPAGWSCTDSGLTVTCTRAGTFATGANDDLLITATAPSTPGSVTAAADISSTSPSDPNDATHGTNNNHASTTFNVLANGADLALTKIKRAKTATTGGNDTVVVAGNTSASDMRSTLTLKNNGPSRITGQAQIVDVLADGEEYISVESGPFTCTASPAVYTPGSPQTVTCNYNGTYPIAVNASYTLQMITRARAASDPGQLSNSACTGGSGGSSEPLTEGGVNMDKITANDCTGLVGIRSTSAGSNLSISKVTSTPTGGDKVVSISENAVTYTLTVTNTGTATPGVVVNDQLPGWVNGTTVDDITYPADWSCTVSGAGSLVCKSGTTQLLQGASATIAITLHNSGNTPGFLMDSVGNAADAACPGAPANTFCNHAGVGVDGNVAGSIGESDWSDNYAADWVRVERVANMQTQSKQITSSPTGQAGVDSVYRITYRNAGPSTVPNVVFNDVFTLPAGDAGFVLVKVGLAPSTTNCSVSATDPGITSTPGGGGMSYANPTGSDQTLTLTCPAVATMTNGNTQTVNLTIRPNVNASNSGRVFNNTAGFTVNGGSATGSDANGAYNYNSDASALDDTKSATLPFTAGTVDLITQKVDVGFTGGIDPLGFDPDTPAANVITYRVQVQNNGPSVASDVRVRDTLTPPNGKQVTWLGMSTTAGGTYATTGCSIDSGSANPATGPATLVLDCQVPGAGFSTNVAGVIASGSSSEVFLRYRYDTAPEANGDTQSNTARAYSAETKVGSDLTAGDVNPANNDATETTSIYQRADVAVQKTAVTVAPAADPAVALPVASGSVTVKQPFWYVVTGINNGPGQSLSKDRTGSSPLNGDGTVIVDTLPAGLVVTGPITWQKAGPAQAGAVPDGTGTCVQAGQTVTCKVGDLTRTSALQGQVRILVPARWDALPSGSTAPLGSANNSASIQTEQVDDNPGNDTVTVPLDVSNLSLGGTVYVDSDRAGGNGGTKQGSEGAIAGVTITLSGTDAYGNAVNRTATTAADGSYKFDNLAPSDASGYTITETQPAGYANGPVAPPTSGSEAATFDPGSYAKGAPNSSYVAVVAPGTVVPGGTIASKGAAGVHYDFPEVSGASLSGYVYADLDGNHVRSAGTDPAIAGATVELLDNASGTVLATTTTDANGFYQFGNLDPGIVYAVREPLPAGYANLPLAVNPGLVNGAACATCTRQTGAGGDVATTDRIAGIDLSAGNGTLFNFGEAAVTAISGTVYLDHNDDGDMNAGDTGIAGVTVTIVGAGPDGVFGTADDTTATLTTDADGHYVYPDAKAGQNYRIDETQPPGLADGKEHPTNTITITGLPLAGATGNDFGELASTLSGRVYLDANNNGHYDAGDQPIAGVKVSLPAGTLDVFGKPVTEATTLPDGSYVFKDLPAGTYTVTEQIAQPVVNGATTLNGTTTAGTVGGATNGTATPVATVPSAVAGIALPAGKTSVENDFGEILPVSIGGTVFFDANDDGIQSGAAETGIPNVDVVLTGTDDTGAAVSVTVKTDANGHYSFEGLRPGIYTVTEPTQPAGTANGKTVAGSAGGTATPVTTVPSAISTIDLRVPGTNSTGNNFAEVPTNASITGKVWLDRDNDGVIDTEETGLPGVTMKLTGTDLAGNPVTRETTTGPDGSYAFDDLPPGTYVVTEPTQPTGTGNGKTVAGSAGGTATPVTTVPSVISAIALGVGQHSSGNDFGELPFGSIAGKAYSDNNDNGNVDTGEAGIGNVQVVLTGTDDLGHAVNLAATTDADGNYRFDGLRPGTYVVTEPTQPPHTLNGITTPGRIGGVQTGNATPKTTVPSAISGIVLPIGGASVDNNFGEIGDSPDLVVSKSATPGKFTVNNDARYTISVRNVGQQPTTGEYLVQDRLPDGVVLAGVPTGAGWTCTGAVGESHFDCRASAVIAAGATSPSTIAVPVTVGTAAAGHGAVNNAVLVSGGGENDSRAPTADERAAFQGNVPALPVCDPAITQNACRVPTEVQLSASVSGTVWQDVGSDRIINGGDTRLQGWTVELVDPSTGAVVRTTTTNADGSYRFADVVPGERWRIRFRDPASGAIWAWPVNGDTASGAVAPCDAAKAIASGGNSSCRVEDGGISQLEVVLKAGEEMPQQSLPVDPSGVVYDAVTRQPVAGAVVTLTPVGTCAGFDPATSLYNIAAGGYSVNGSAVSMTTGADGFYQFWFSAAAPARCEFQITVTPPGGYTFASTMIPAETQPLSPPGATGSAYQVQPNAGAPTGAVGTDTRYYLSFFTGSGTAGIVHNHIPLDAAVATGLTITKTGDRQVVEVGDTLQYTITVRQTAGSALSTVNVVDRLPHGFTYIAGTARANGRAITEPLGQPGPRLSFDVGPITVGGQIALTYRVRVGVGSQQGDGINRAQAFGCSIAGGCVDGVQLQPLPGALSSNQAQYRVKVTGGVFTSEGCVLGKIFVDCNNNHVQDAEEIGIPGVRLYFEDGTWVISDAEGKYSYCGLQPQSHTLKVDASTLPVGSRLTTSSNRNLGDADSLFIDLKNGELHRADFVEGSCSNPVIEQVKARRTQGEVRAPETEPGQPALRFESKPLRAPQQATDSANQRPIVDPRPTTSGDNKESQP